MAAMRWRTVLASFLLSMMLLTTACSTQPPSPYESIQQETTGRNAPEAVSQDALAGSNFNRFFPASANGLEVVPSQEKQGFAEYKLNQGGTTVAMLSINDTTSNPASAQKFADSTEQIAGYPAVDIGSQQTAILVSDRFQVKVQSRDDSFARSDRVAWLEQFDLSGLARLE
ncbi:MAG: hypothetical protein WBA43_14365 [Elainellaceae cyanobacterium]